jgi:malate/lactate dehydrogenase
MNLVVVGCGNVGANLLQQLAGLDRITRIYAFDRDDDIVRAAIMDVAGVHPQLAHKIEGGDRTALSGADLVVMTAGAKSKAGQTRADVLRTNKAILDDVFYNATLKHTAIVLTIPGPVEVLAMYLSRLLDHPPQQVLGFGGDLDLNRLRYVLLGRGASTKGASIVGEHGSRAIPIYGGVQAYDEVADRVQNFLSSIDRLAGVKRNLATAPLLARLTRSILEDSDAVHCVANPHPEYGLWLTWPFRVNQRGADRMVAMKLEPNAGGDLQALIETRRREEAELEKILAA